jgi:hypothetical protein
VVRDIYARRLHEALHPESEDAATVPPLFLFDVLTIATGRKGSIVIGSLSPPPDSGMSLFDLTRQLIPLWGREPLFSQWILSLFQAGWLESHPDPYARELVTEEGAPNVVEWGYVTDALDMASVIRVRPALSGAFAALLDSDASTLRTPTLRPVSVLTLSGAYVWLFAVFQLQRSGKGDCWFAPSPWWVTEAVFAH